MGDYIISLMVRNRPREGDINLGVFVTSFAVLLSCRMLLPALGVDVVARPLGGVGMARHERTCT